MTEIAQDLPANEDALNSEFFDKGSKKYRLKGEGKEDDSAGLLDYYRGLMRIEQELGAGARYAGMASMRTLQAKK